MAETKYRVYKQNLRTSEKLYKRYKNMQGWTHDSRFACEYNKRSAQQLQYKHDI